jgi:hypothetical protein
LARRLPGNVEVECRLGLPTWPATLGGVDIVFDPQRNGRRVGIETKVWDVEDALFDLLKLASAVQYSALTMGYLVIAARPRDWARSSVVSTMSAASHPACLSTTWGQHSY